MSVIIPDTLKPFIRHSFNPVVIPKIIHQTYKSLEKLPKGWRQTPESWMRNNPTWKYMFWSDHDNRELVKKHFPGFLPIFDGYEYPIQRADAIRPILMYVYGGIYSDMDNMCSKPIDDLFYKDADIFLLRTPNGGIITNSIMASKPGDKFWLYVIDVMKSNAKNPSALWVSKHILVMNTTGPSMLNFVYKNYPTKDRISFLPQTYLFPEQCNVCSEKPCTTKESYITILDGSSWCDLDSDIIKFVYCNRVEAIFLIFISILIYLIYKFYPII